MGADFQSPPDPLLQRVLPSIVAGLVNGVLIVIFQSAYAALIFDGALSGYAASGMGVMLFGAFAMGLIMALTSAFHSTITAPQDAPTAILALTAAAITASVLPAAGLSSAFATVIAAIALTALATGISFLILGWFRLGKFVRFIPYPVVGGFLAGTGWILVRGAIGIMSGEPFSLGNVRHFLEWSSFQHWLPGLFFAVLLLLTVRRFRHFLTIPVMILAATLIFYLVLLVTRTSYATAAADGWLMNQFASGAIYPPVEVLAEGAIRWKMIWQSAGDLASVVVISVISLLLNASGLELIARREIDLNRELRATGLANLVSGLGGSSVGYMSLSLTALGYRIGARSRVSGLTSASICGVTLLFGLTLPSYFPRPLLGGLLMYLGLTFLVDWLYSAWFKLPRAEYFLVILILLTIGLVGFLPGMALGMVISIVLFVINYSRINVMKHLLTGENYQSNVDRARPQQHLLKRHGAQVLVLKLQGYLFFGTANTILEAVRVRVLGEAQEPVRFVLIDFRLVSGLDSSALNSFEKLKMLASSQAFCMFFSSLSPIMVRQFAAVGINDAEAGIQFVDTLDHALEAAEDQIIAAASGTSGTLAAVAPTDSLDAFLADIMMLNKHNGMQISRLSRIKKYFVSQEFTTGAALIIQGAQPAGLYILTSGWVTVQLDRESGHPLRLRKMGAGTLIGELSVYLDKQATASVIANGACTAAFLSMDQLKRMESEEPAAYAFFLKFVVSVLAERLSSNNRTIEALQK